MYPTEHSFSKFRFQTRSLFDDISVIHQVAIKMASKNSRKIKVNILVLATDPQTSKVIQDKCYYEPL